MKQTGKLSNKGRSAMHAAAATQQEKPRMGRPPKEGGTMAKPFPLRLPSDILEAVDEVAAALPDKQERSVAIRMLLREALAARAKGRK